MRGSFLTALIVELILCGPAVLANHVPHDTRPNPNCAWDSSRSADFDGDGEPDHMVVGATHNTSFPRQIVERTGPMPDPISWAGANDGPDDVTIVVQGDHRMLGANPPHQQNGEPEQLHNGAIYAHADYDEVEDGRTPRAEWGAGVYEADTLVMACGATDEDVRIGACPAGHEIYFYPDGDCPTG